MTAPDRIFRYVRHGRINDYAALGWCVVDTLNGTNHGHFAVLMEYFGPEIDPPEPEKQHDH
jgi:hypothetical protein